jgi:squalene-associated FAD-dependent desaturase
MTASESPAAPASVAARRVVIVGGGLAGLAAAVGLAGHGLSIELYEARRQLGGRATSFRDPQSGALVDHCQHVSMGCCTNLADLCRRTGLADLMKCYRTLHFFGPDGRRCDVSGSRWLPAPLHLLPSLLRLDYLSFGVRLKIARGMLRLARLATSSDSQTIGQWLRKDGQSPRAIELFWTPVIVSALSETVDRASVSAARKVFVDGFMAGRDAYELHIPQVPLGDFYGWQLEQWFTENGVTVRSGWPAINVVGDVSGIREIEFNDDRRAACEAVILAVPWRRIGELVGESLGAALPELRGIDKIESAPITAVHFWFDRPITDLPHAVLPGRTSQWLFNRGTAMGQVSNLPEAEDVATAHHYQVVISASRDLADQSREQITAEVLKELASLWPVAGEAKVLQSKIITQQHSVFSPQPGVDRFRPSQQTSIRNLFLAGDWTATGWPATMEGAVRSGYLAAEAVLKFFGQSKRLLMPDLPKSWLARRLIG